ncbi:MAG: Glutathione S-transferase family protein [Labilithrix sp.]|nr:Glutathione S-transferase family protein [Labilithrix sp.]
MRTLYGLRISLYTEKARWALDHHELPFHYHEHVPLLGEPLLRLKSKGRPPGTKATVPLLVDGDEAFTTSLAIARHADAIGTGAPLFAPGREEEVERWAARSDRIIEIGRTSLIRGMASSPEAQRENLPDLVPGPLKGALGALVTMGVGYVGSKHAVAHDSAAVAAETRPVLDELRAAVARGPYLATDSFGFADAAIATALGALRPHEAAPLGPATRALLTQPALADEYADLLAWRDEIYRKHRARA